MMSQRKIYYTLFLIICMGLSSCNKWLDLKPQDGLIGDEFWQTKEQVQSALIGCYTSMLVTPSGGRPMAENLFMYGEFRGDMVKPGLYASTDEQDIMNVNILPTNTYTDWTDFYRVINYCNNVIDNAPAVRKKDPTFSQTELDGYLAEALTIRAYMYFMLARTWGSAPLKLTATKNDTDNFQIPVSTQEELFQQIEKDLLEAEGKAKESYGSSITDKGRITKFTVNAFLADLYLWMEQYDKAVTACNKIIDSKRYSLVSGNSAWFTVLYANGNSNEGIFELQFDAQALNPFYTMLFQRPRYIAAPRVLEEIYTVDPQNPDSVDIRGERAALVAADNSIYKYSGLDRSDRKTLDQSFTHWFVYRYADILLMKAEALNQLGQGQEALDLIATIRSRGKALLATKRSPNPNDKDGITDYIVEERAREFAFEGKRWFDVLRNAKRNNYQRSDLLINMITYNAPADRQQSIIEKYKDKNSHYLPIHFQELLTNKALIQNPFYK